MAKAKEEKMKKQNFIFMGLLALAAFSLLGLDQSSQATLKTYVPYDALWVGENVASFDWNDDNLDITDAKKLGKTKLWQWSDVLKQVDFTRKKENSTFEVNSADFETIVRNNVFTFTKVSVDGAWRSEVWDFSLKTSDESWQDLPSPMVLYRILSDTTNKNSRQVFVDIIKKVLKDPATKAAWEKKLAEFDESKLWRDYVDDLHYMRSLSYEQAVQKALDKIIAEMQSTDFSLKVMPEGKYWSLVRVVNDVIEFVYDDSLLRIHSTCYKIGQQNTQILLGYIQEIKADFLKKS